MFVFVIDQYTYCMPDISCCLFRKLSRQRSRHAALPVCSSKYTDLGYLDKGFHHTYNCDQIHVSFIPHTCINYVDKLTVDKKQIFAI